MRAYPLEPLRRLHAERADRAGATVAARSIDASEADLARGREADQLARVDELVAEDHLPHAVLDLRTIARLGAHRTRLRGIRAEAAARLAEATARVEAAQEALANARLVQRAALHAREAIHAHRRDWLQTAHRARDRAEDAAMDELATERWERAKDRTDGRAGAR
jgi:hypothetical protein